jgi:hypothetical protein
MVVSGYLISSRGRCGRIQIPLTAIVAYSATLVKQRHLLPIIGLRWELRNISHLDMISVSRVVEVTVVLEVAPVFSLLVRTTH